MSINESSQNRRKCGSDKEDAAAEYLRSAGVTILHRNYRCRFGEIDLIGLDGACLVFYEVKYRHDTKRYDPVVAVDHKKQKKISKVALYFLTMEYRSLSVPCRFDVIGVTDGGMRHIKNAFPYQA